MSGTAKVHATTDAATSLGSYRRHIIFLPHPNPTRIKGTLRREHLYTSPNPKSINLRINYDSYSTS